MRTLLALLFAAAALPAAAQQPAIRVNGAAAEAADARLQLAEQYLRAGEADRAIALLEDLYAASPSPLAYARLMAAYTEAGRFDDAAALVERRIEAEGPSPSLLADQATVLHRAGRTEEAEAAWAAAVEAAPGAEMTYRLVANAMANAQLYDRAAAVFRQGRERLGDAALFQAELANVCGLAADYACAADEYLALLAEQPDAVEVVQVRLGRLLEGEGAADAFRAALDRAVRRDPLNRAYRELSAWVAVEAGEWTAALEANVAIDRLEREEGQSLFAFAEAAVTGEAFAEAERAYALIVEQHPDGPLAPLALLGRARLAERRAEAEGERAFDAAGERVPAPGYEAALDGYRAFAERHPHHPEADAALAAAARLYRAVFRDYAAAEGILRALAARTADPAVSGQARLDLGRLDLQQGDLGAARAAFAAVEEGLRIGPLAEEARLELARLDFYEGDFEGALARVRAMNENTATDVANDAIALKVLLMENEGPDSLSTPLRAYAGAALLQRQGRAAEALDAFDALLAEHPAHPIADEAVVARVEALRALGRTDEALATLEGFPERFQGSYLAERALFLIGEVHERDRGDAAAAQAAYTDFLARYPGSLLAPEARARVRRLRGDRPPG
ncbi:MAG TPA: tetratricopeptide repeat protein, partial [Rubricoccaceae bacterium]|nr:tetratricopeptide repeat protein [Rubricoccaceae bacterium]